MIKHILAPKWGRWLLKLFKFDGFSTYWNTIWYVGLRAKYNSKLRIHEETHIRQMKEDGKIWFTVKYLGYLIRYGYWDNPYEVEARGR